MKTIKPKSTTSSLSGTEGTHQDEEAQLTSVEQGKLWTTYMGNTMGVCVLRYMLHNVDDPDIRDVLGQALGVSESMIDKVGNMMTEGNFPLPQGFTADDVNLNAKRLFADEFYLHYLKYVSKAGMSVYSIAISITSRPDVRRFFTECLDSTMQVMNRVNDLLTAKGLLTKPPVIPYPDEVSYVRKQSYLNGFFGDMRPLQALEIAHLYENIENNATSKAVLIGFSQVAQSEQTRAYFLRGKEIAAKHYDIFKSAMEKEDLSAPPLLDPYVTSSTIPPFSDKLMMAHKLDMYAMRIRTYGNALAFSSRHDITQKYARLLVEVGNYVEDGANILIEHGWMEQPPHAVDREALAAR